MLKPAAILLVLLSVATPAVAHDRMLVEKSPGERVDEVLERVLGALRLVLRTIPQYEMPEVLPNGDILIRRVPPEPEPEPKPDPKSEPDSTRT